MPWYRVVVLLAVAAATGSCAEATRPEAAIFTESRSLFPLATLDGPTAAADLELPIHWDLGDVTVHGYNDDLVLAYHGANGPWADADKSGGPEAQASNGNVLLTQKTLRADLERMKAPMHGALLMVMDTGRQVGLPVDVPVVLLANWYKPGSGEFVRRVVGRHDGESSVIDLQPAVAMGRLVIGSDGPDGLKGGPGTDILVGGGASDLLMGGPGNDTYRISSGDGDDVILDEAGTDTVEFGPGIEPSHLALRRETNGMAIQVRRDPGWNYLQILVVPGKTTGVEAFRFADGTVLSDVQLADRVTDMAPDAKGHRADVRLATTVTVAPDEVDPTLREAVLASTVTSGSGSLCLRLPLSPRPLEVRGGPSMQLGEFFLTVHGRPDSEAQRTQLRQLQVLAAVGLLADEVVPVPGADEPGLRFTLTWEGWGQAGRNEPCFEYASSGVLAISGYRPDGRKLEGRDLYVVEARIGATKLAPWAKQSVVSDAFPEIVRQVEGQTADVVVARQGSAWIPVRNGRVWAEAVQRPYPPVPSLDDVLVAGRAAPNIPDWAAPLCVEPPMLGESRLAPPNAVWETVGTDPLPSGGQLGNRMREAKARLDLLVRLGVAQSRRESRADARGRPLPRLVYSIHEPYVVRRQAITGGPCLVLGESRFDVLSVRQNNPGAATARGRWTAAPDYDWVMSPDFLAAFPRVAPILGDGVAVQQEMTHADGSWSLGCCWSRHDPADVGAPR